MEKFNIAFCLISSSDSASSPPVATSILFTLKEFFIVNDKTDAYRQETFTDIFPEFGDLRKYCFNESVTDEELEDIKFGITVKGQEDQYNNFLINLRDTKGQKHSTKVHKLVKDWNQ